MVKLVQVLINHIQTNGLENEPYHTIRAKNNKIIKQGPEKGLFKS